MKRSTRGIAPRLFFDGKDHDLLAIVDDVLDRKDYSGLRQLLAPHMHPRGIKEMAASQGLRIAYACVNLLGSLDRGAVDDRLVAMRALKDEVMNASAASQQTNTARVLLQIMKELVRSREDPRRRLELAHDFRMAATGRPRTVARQLRRHHLLPMPEDRSQDSFDDHVHDANTKGRKSPSHLIMDAWIKGIRRLTVIYYNFILPEAAEELLLAAEIMDIKVRVGIEFQTRHRDKSPKIVWVPRGFSGAQDFLAFLRQTDVSSFLESGMHLSRAREEHVRHALDRFNGVVLPDLNDYFGIRMEPADREGFLQAVGNGQASMLHLGRHLHRLLLPHLEARFQELKSAWEQAAGQEREALAQLIEEMNALDAESLVDDYLEGAHREWTCGQGEAPGPAALLDSIRALRAGNRFILNLHGLTRADVLEILLECSGGVTHLEIVNLKNILKGEAGEYERITALQQLINAPSIIGLKRWIMGRIEELEQAATPEAQALRARLDAVLPRIAELHAHYRHKPLRSSVGSDSTGQSCGMHGMGLVVLETLPPKARAQAASRSRLTLPVGVKVRPSVALSPRESSLRALDAAYAFLRRRPLLCALGYSRTWSYKCKEYHPAPGGGNLLVMGGVQRGCGNGFSVEDEAGSRGASRPSWRYLNSAATNALKVLAGFIPAFLSFFLSKDWWVLKFLGAFIWFAITGLRNIIQSVLGAGGFKRTPLLKWNDYVSWSRLADSLLYTGFSVPLLDVLVKTLVLDKGLGITAASNPLALYGTMALVNGCYISGHNWFRGLPKGAVAGNFFRSVLSIPLAMCLNSALGLAVSLFDPAAAAPVLQQWAAVLSKLASDCVAGVIEGLADRGNNMRQRIKDYKAKVDQMLAVQEKLEVLFPKDGVSHMFDDPRQFMLRTGEAHRDLANAVIVNALDVMYLWMLQPRGMSALAATLKGLEAQEREVFLCSQRVLTLKREISQLFLDGLLGKDFSRGLAFYLGHGDVYLRALSRLDEATRPTRRDAPRAA